MKLIHDPIHGYIELDDFAVRLVDTPEFQRLRRITQLGFAFLAYPSARHTLALSTPWERSTLPRKSEPTTRKSRKEPSMPPCSTTLGTTHFPIP
ncbi:hypothetical protein [Thermococcus sp. Bubb.Bath]|uniref:hypothetical protein n=1 Tax=Thermococcus sp. Bubb.Bath TaxID=1638242 RepID=UPI003183B5E7